METTTLRVTRATRDALESVKRATGASSQDEALARLIQRWTPTAQELYQDREGAVLATCKKHGIERLVAFGSRVRSDRAPDSDLDLVAEFRNTPSIFQLANATDDLSEAFGVQVDLGTMPEADSRLSQHIQEEGVQLVP